MQPFPNLAVGTSVVLALPSPVAPKGRRGPIASPTSTTVR